MLQEMFGAHDIDGEEEQSTDDGEVQRMDEIEEEEEGEDIIFKRIPYPLAQRTTP
jgi:hypothetical protein